MAYLLKAAMNSSDRMVVCLVLWFVALMLFVVL